MISSSIRRGDVSRSIIYSDLSQPCLVGYFYKVGNSPSRVKTMMWDLRWITGHTFLDKSLYMFKPEDREHIREWMKSSEFPGRYLLRCG